MTNWWLQFHNNLNSKIKWSGQGLERGLCFVLTLGLIRLEYWNINNVNGTHYWRQCHEAWHGPFFVLQLGPAHTAHYTRHCTNCCTLAVLLFARMFARFALVVTLFRLSPRSLLSSPSDSAKSRSFLGLSAYSTNYQVTQNHPLSSDVFWVWVWHSIASAEFPSSN